MALSMPESSIFWTPSILFVTQACYCSYIIVCKIYGITSVRKVDVSSTLPRDLMRARRSKASIASW